MGNIRNAHLQSHHKGKQYYGDFVLISNEKMDTFHDKSETFKKDKVVINWLNNLSVAKVFDCFDTVQDTTVNSNIGKASWRTEAIKG